VLGRPFGAEHGARTTAVSPEATNTHSGHYPEPKLLVGFAIQIEMKLAFPRFLLLLHLASPRLSRFCRSFLKIWHEFGVNTENKADTNLKK
jgi:hypothetical protein